MVDQSEFESEELMLVLCLCQSWSSLKTFRHVKSPLADRSTDLCALNAAQKLPWDLGLCFVCGWTLLSRPWQQRLLVLSASCVLVWSLRFANVSATSACLRTAAVYLRCSSSETRVPPSTRRTCFVYKSRSSHPLHTAPKQVPWSVSWVPLCS